VSDLGNDEVAVRVSVSIPDPASPGDGEGTAAADAGFSGVISELGAGAAERLEVGDTVFGVGPVAEQAVVAETQIGRLPAGARLSDAQAAAIPYLRSFLFALGAIRPEAGDRVLITGQPVIRHLGEQFLAALLPDTPIARAHSEADESLGLLVHGLTDASELQRSLSALRHDAEAYVLVPTGTHILSLDFYPHIHRSSLRVIVRRVGNPYSPEAYADPDISRLIELLERGQIDIEPVLEHAVEWS
jgi:hypothetical protein